ncbi:DUF1109 domain-containing protein [Methylophilus flavus]|uniref:DUF1109 domain-containing protein n=1 Tax=Methylophilus flavus TaxID=640084 RepID=A0ABW3P8X2_9PROT
MKTDELIKMLSTGVEPVAQHANEKGIAQALLAGAAISFLLLITIYGIRPDLRAVSTSFAFWMKLGVPLASALMALTFVTTLSYPGKFPKVSYWVLSLPVLALWIWAISTWVGADASQHAGMVWGKTWRVCIMNITFLAVPVGGLTLLALRNLAPTQPVLTGAMAGWLAGSTGASIYALHCPEMAAPFLAIWYVLGMLVPTAIMAYVGHRSLRW